MTLHDKHPQRMMRDMLKMTHQIFEPIRMSREEGSLSRSVTTRAPASHLGRRKGGPVRLSRDLKGTSSPLANGQSAANSQTNGSGLPSIALEGEPVPDNGNADTNAADVSGGAGVGTGSGSAAVGAKLQRRLGPSSARFNLTRGVSAPEMFSEVPTFKKKPVLEGAAAEAAGQEEDDSAKAATPGLLNTTGLKHAAGGERSSRSPLRQSMMATSTSAEDVIDEEDEKEQQAEETSSVNSEHTRVEPRSQEGSEATTTEAANQEEAADWKPVSGAEFEASGGGRKLERRRKNRQSGLGQPGSGSDSALSVDGLSAESVLQALREEGP